MTVRESVPKPLRGPVGFISLGVMIVSVALGYIITLLGITLYFNMGIQTVNQGINKVEAMQVTLIGVVLLVIAYLSWKGFLYFSY